ncbi:MAG: hypothetical protein EZS28_048175, partial [Streblomastix strix]
NSLKNAYTVSNLPHSPNNIQTPKDNSQVSKTESQPPKTEIQSPQVISSDPQIPSQTTQADSKINEQLPDDAQLKYAVPRTPKFIPKVSKTLSQASLVDSNVNKHTYRTQQIQKTTKTPYDGRNSLNINYQVSNLPHIPALQMDQQITSLSPVILDPPDQGVSLVAMKISNSQFVAIIKMKNLQPIQDNLAGQVQKIFYRIIISFQQQVILPNLADQELLVIMK